MKKVFNKFDWFSYVAFIVGIGCFLIPGSEKIPSKVFPLQEIGIYWVAVGCLLTGRSALYALKQEKNIQFNRLMVFAGFGMGGMLILTGLFKISVILLLK